MAKPKTEHEYIIVSDCSKDALQQRVNEYISAGYEPTGGIAVYPGRTPFGDPYVTFYQAMIRKTE